MIAAFPGPERSGTLIELWYYCVFSNRALIYYTNEATIRLIVVDDK